MYTTRFNQIIAVIIYRRDGVNFVSLVEKGFYKAHPEIVNIPGSVEHDSDFHELIAKTLLLLKSGGFDSLM